MGRVFRAPLSAAVLIGCADGREALSVPVVFVPAEAAFALDEAVEITLTEARLTISDLHLLTPDHGTARLGAWSPIGTAHAHPGHGGTGSVTGELLGSWSLDLLGAPTELGAASCWEGDTATARWVFPAEPAATLVGTATVHGIEHPFAFTVAPDHSLEGLPFVASLQADRPLSRITLAADPARILSFIDWSSLPDQTPLTEVDPALENSVIAGLLSTRSYLLTPEP